MPRILVLDDEPLIAMMLEDWLIEIGHEVVGPAHTAAAALELVDREPIDGAFLDLNLGAGISYAVADALTAKAVPFAFMTGHGGAVQANYADAPVLAKPFDFEAMKRALSKIGIG